MTARGVTEAARRAAGVFSSRRPDGDASEVGSPNTNYGLVSLLIGVCELMVIYVVALNLLQMSEFCFAATISIYGRNLKKNIVSLTESRE